MVLKATLQALPEIESLRKLTQSLAMLDAIMSPEWEYRYYSFNSKWSEGEMMASMRNGSGEEYFILFDSHGAIMKGFDHESEMSPWASEDERLWPGIFDDVPDEFQNFLSEPVKAYFRHSRRPTSSSGEIISYSVPRCWKCVRQDRLAWDT